jgi:hypothetical protein
VVHESLLTPRSTVEQQEALRHVARVLCDELIRRINTPVFHAGSMADALDKNLVLRLDDIRDTLSVILARSSSPDRSIAAVVADLAQENANLRKEVATLSKHGGLAYTTNESTTHDPDQATWPNPDQRAMETEIAGFQEALPTLLKTLEGIFVAFSGGQVLDQDTDEIRLAERVCAAFPDEHILVRKVSRDAQPDVWLSSPEVVI